MRYADAPTSGWYPDPESRTRLRWWDGFDWTDIHRAPPSDAELLAAEELQEFFDNNELVAAGRQAGTRAGGAMTREDSKQLVEEVRIAARQEIDRAADEFSNRATTAVRRVTPLITEYTSVLKKWVKRAVIISIVLLAAYFIFQVVVQASFFDWLGDRIDSVTDDSDTATGLSIGRVPLG